LSTASASDLLELEAFAKNCDNSLVRDLIEEGPVADVRRPREVKGCHFTRVEPEPVPSPYLIAASPSCAELLGLDPKETSTAEFLNVFSGNHLLPGLTGWATVYGCHCGGQWFGQLGDGRAMSIGEAIHPKTGHRHEMQLKGCGRTPYSRQFDGRAVVRSSIREFLASEAMGSLGVPTTRALCVLGHEEKIQRAWYPESKEKSEFAGRPHPPQMLKVEPGAVLCRVAPSFIRFAQLELFWKRDDPENFFKLADHAIAREYPWIKEKVEKKEITRVEGYVELLKETAKGQALLIAEWLRVGYVQGNMNSDNTLVGGRTLDYGPFGFMEKFDPSWSPFTSDPAKNFGFLNQPRAALVNVIVHAQGMKAMLSRLIADEGQDAKDKLDADIQDAVDGFGVAFKAHHETNCRKKLGLRKHDPSLWSELLSLMGASDVDFTLFFRHLAQASVASDPNEALKTLADAFYEKPDQDKWKIWMARYMGIVKEEGRDAKERVAEMNSVNPKYILRNWMATLAYEAAEEKKDYSMVAELLTLLSRPYDDQPDAEKKWSRLTPEWARGHPGVAFMS